MIENEIVILDEVEQADQSSSIPYRNEESTEPTEGFYSFLANSLWHALMQPFSGEKITTTAFIYSHLPIELWMKIITHLIECEVDPDSELIRQTIPSIHHVLTIRQVSKFFKNVMDDNFVVCSIGVKINITDLAVNEVNSTAKLIYSFVFDERPPTVYEYIQKSLKSNFSNETLLETDLEESLDKLQIASPPMCWSLERQPSFCSAWDVVDSCGVYTGLTSAFSTSVLNVVMALGGVPFPIIFASMLPSLALSGLGISCARFGINKYRYHAYEEQVKQNHELAIKLKEKTYTKKIGLMFVPVTEKSAIKFEEKKKSLTPR